MRNKHRSLIIAFILSSAMNLYAGGCPEIRSFKAELSEKGGTIVLKAAIEPNRFRLFERVEVYRVEKPKTERFVKGRSTGLWPREIAQGKNSIVLFSGDDFSLLAPDTVYRVVFDIDGFEGCVSFREIYFILKKENGAISLFQAPSMEELDR